MERRLAEVRGWCFLFLSSGKFDLPGAIFREHRAKSEFPLDLWFGKNTVVGADATSYCMQAPGGTDTFKMTQDTGRPVFHNVGIGTLSRLSLTCSGAEGELGGGAVGPAFAIRATSGQQKVKS